MWYIGRKTSEQVDINSYLGYSSGSFLLEVSIPDEIVALKRLKIEKEREGFPITALREINMLLKAGKHENVVNVSSYTSVSTFTLVGVVLVGCWCFFFR